MMLNPNDPYAQQVDPKPQQQTGGTLRYPAATPTYGGAGGSEQGQAAPGLEAKPSYSGNPTDLYRNVQEQVYKQINTPTPTRESPQVRAQVDPFAAAQERTRRTAENEAAERMSTMGMGESGAMQNERRIAQERAGQATGAFEAGVMREELMSQRDQINKALEMGAGMMSNDQKDKLQRDLAALDAAIKREGLAQTGVLGATELDIRRQLGLGGLNVDLIRSLLGHQQGMADIGLRAGLGEADLNQRAMALLMGGF